MCTSSESVSARLHALRSRSDSGTPTHPSLTPRRHDTGASQPTRLTACRTKNRLDRANVRQISAAERNTDAPRMWGC